MNTLLSLFVAIAPLSAPQEGVILQFQAKEIILADGTRIPDGLMIVTDGKITRISTGDPDPGLPLVEHDGVLSAGMIACQTRSGALAETSDPTRSILPEARLLHAFNPEHSDFEEAIAAGITSVVLAPAAINVVGGLTAVVKTAGPARSADESTTAVVLAREAHLALSFAATSLAYNAPRRRGSFFGAADAEGAVAAGTREGGLEFTEAGTRGAREPTSYGGAVRALAQRFTFASAEEAASDNVFARAARGDLPVFIEAWTRNEVARAAGFASKYQLKGALRGALLAGDPGLLPEIVRSGLAVIVGPFDVGHTRRSLEAVRELQSAGVDVGFALDGPGFEADTFRLSAALAVGAGADREMVWRSLTSVGARIAGVDGRVGSLEPGKDADFVLWSGAPLNLTSRVEAVYVDGALAWSAANNAK